MINIFVCLSKLDIIDNGDKKIKRDLASFQIKDVAYFLTKFLSTFSFANWTEIFHQIVFRYEICCVMLEFLINSKTNRIFSLW